MKIEREIRVISHERNLTETIKQLAKRIGLENLQIQRVRYVLKPKKMLKKLEIYELFQ